MPSRGGEVKNFYLPLARVHVLEGFQWGQAMGTDYWLTFNPAFDLAVAASTALGEQLAENGWVATVITNTAGSGADFGSSTDVGIPNHMLTNATSDLLKSPVIFGDYAHMHAAGRIVGKGLPRTLNAEFWGSMSVHSTDDPATGWGFFEDGGSPIVAADQNGFISSDATNFQIGANASYSNGTTDDATWHLFKIVLDRSTLLATWFIDGTRQMNGADVSSIAITADEFPVGFGFGVDAAGTNRPLLGLTHVYYDW